MAILTLGLWGSNSAGAIAIPALSTPDSDVIVPQFFNHTEIKNRNFSGENLQTAEFADAIVEVSDFSHANLRGAIFSASALVLVNLHGADLSHSMVDQSRFVNTDLSDALLVNALMLKARFENTDITGADFTDAILDRQQIRLLCAVADGVNSTTGVATRDSLGCPS